MNLWAEYKAFLTKSNALALAVGIIIGVALGAVVTSLVNDIIMPVVGYVLGGVDFSSFKFVLAPASGDKAEVSINYGLFINTVIAFVVIAFVAFALTKVLLPKPVPGPAMKTCPQCGEEVLATAKRCKFCTSDLA
ncbi:MAG: large conductance mechanosensitive channel protein MscL [Chloroflexota bacterium]